MIPPRYSAPPCENRRIGLFGGSFNPPHAGHRAVSLWALKRLGLDEVWWLVSPQNPLKDPRETGDFATRLTAARALSQHPRFKVTGLEARLGTRITAETLKSLAPLFGRGQFVWIMGADSFAGLHHWHRWREIPARLPIAVIDRPGWTLKALASPAARALARFRLPESAARELLTRPAPAWVFLTMPRRKESSTALRQARTSP